MTMNLLLSLKEVFGGSREVDGTKGVRDRWFIRLRDIGDHIDSTKWMIECEWSPESAH